LRDGRYVFLAPVLPEDRHRLEAAFDLLSDRSRHFRFFRRSDRLSEAELREFTEVDQVDHVAWCALDAPDPPFDGLASARMIRDRDDRRSAEVAVTVLDSCQGLGLGTVMLGVLVLRARMLGVDRLRAVTLPENDVVRRWLLDLGWSIVREDAMVEFECSTGPPGLADQLRPSRARFDHLLEVLRPPLERCLERTRGADADRP
jgi:GNAT superfamily N-acetyltransferase